MSRRSRTILPAGRDERSSLGDFHVETAIGTVNALAQRTVTTMTSYDLTAEQTLPMLFYDGDLAKLRQVRGMVIPESQIMHYNLQPAINLYVNYKNLSVPAIQPDFLHLQPSRMAPLINHIAAVKAVHDRFEEVKGVLRWLNRNATPGAVRFYWPTAMKLCPSAPIWRELQEVPSRYSVPAKLGVWLQSLKDAAATVAGAQMLPAHAVARPRNDMWLKFATYNVTLDSIIDDGHYSTNEMIYNL